MWGNGGVDIAVETATNAICARHRDHLALDSAALHNVPITWVAGRRNHDTLVGLLQEDGEKQIEDGTQPSGHTQVVRVYSPHTISGKDMVGEERSKCRAKPPAPAGIVVTCPAVGRSEG